MRKVFDVCFLWSCNDMPVVIRIIASLYNRALHRRQIKQHSCCFAVNKKPYLCLVCNSVVAISMFLITCKWVCDILNCVLLSTWYHCIWSGFQFQGWILLTWAVKASDASIHAVIYSLDSSWQQYVVLLSIEIL